MRRLTFGAFLAAGLLVCLGLVFFVAPRASSSPDGLSRVAIDEGLDTNERPSAMADSPTAGYAVDGVDHEGLSTGLAGAIGVGATFALGLGLVAVLRRRSAGADGAVDGRTGAPAGSAEI